MVFVALPFSSVVDALASALRSGHLIRARGVLSAVDMVGARGELVRVTHGFVAIITTSYNAIGFHVSPSKLGDAAVATMVFEYVARRQILR